MKNGAKRNLIAALVAVAGLTLSTGLAAQEKAPESEAAQEEDLGALLAQMLAGKSRVQGDELDAKLDEAAQHPLGSVENPVRAQGPAGQRAYLARLRCSNMERPEFFRRGSAGVSPYGNIVDVYAVTCEGAEPAESDVFIDMYHRGHVESEAVPGFGIIGGREP